MRKHNDSVRLTGLSVEVHDDFNKSLRIFNKKVQESGIVRELRDRQYFEPPSDIKTRKKKLARKRWLKKLAGKEVLTKRLY